MAIAFVNSTSAVTSSITTSVSCPVPSGANSSNNLLLATVASSQSSIATPSGWTFGGSATSADGCTMTVFYKIASGTVTSPVVLSAGSTTGTMASKILQFSGVDTSTPYRTRGTNTGNNTTSFYCGVPSGAQSTDWTIVCVGVRPEAAGTPTLTMPSGTFTTIGAIATSTGSSYPAVMGVAYDPGGTNNPTASTNIAVTSAAVGIVFRQATTGGGVTSSATVNNLGIPGTIPSKPILPPPSTRFFSEIVTSNGVYSYVDVVSPTLNQVTLEAVDGTVTVDRTSDVRRRFSMTCVDSTGTVTPENAGDLLTPYGTVIYPYRGVRYASDQTTEVCPLGVFRLSKAVVKDTGKGTIISLEGYDLARTIQRDKFTSPYNVTSGTNVLTAIKQIISRTFDNAVYNAVSTNLTVPSSKVYDRSNDPWAACLDLARSMGCEIYFDVNGIIVIRPPTDITSLSQARYTWQEGTDCMMLELERVFNDEPGYNGVVVTGENPSNNNPPVSATVWDTEPSSLTYHLGPYGEVPMFYTDQNITTTNDATAVATALLNSQLGFTSQLSVTARVNPALEGGDTIKVVRSGMGINDLYVVDSFAVPLKGSGTQSVILRQRRVQS